MTAKTLIESARAMVLLDCSGKPDVLEACQRIIDYVDASPDNRLQHLTFGMLASLSRADSVEVSSDAISYLSGDIVRLLKIQFEFIDGEDIFPISASEVGLATQNGVFVHPDTGEPVEQFRDKIYIYFVPSWISDVEGNS